MNNHDNSEQELWIASRRYLLGEITVEQLKEIEKPHMEAFNNALLELAKRDVCRKWKFWRKHVH